MKTKKGIIKTDDQCDNCDKHILLGDDNYWHEKMLCGDCWDLEYADAKQGMEF